MPKVKKGHDDFPEKDQICKCTHSLDRHRTSNSGKSKICIEQFCHCSNFDLNNIK